MKRKPYQQYSREFKVEAIRLAEAGNKTATQVARELGIRVNQIGKWKKQLEREELRNQRGQCHLFSQLKRCLYIQHNPHGLAFQNQCI